MAEVTIVVVAWPTKSKPRQRPSIQCGIRTTRWSLRRSSQQGVRLCAAAFQEVNNMRFSILLMFAAACFGQGKQNVSQTGVVDAHGANWIRPTATFASPPSSPPTGAVYVFTDASGVGTCSGGGSDLAACRWSGSAWSAVGGGGGGFNQASIFSGGTRLQRAVECASGTVFSAALTAAAANQEITIQTGISG